MNKCLGIAAREIRSAFATPVAYVVISGFLFIAGFFFFSLLQQFNNVVAQSAMLPDVTPSFNEWVILPFYQTLEIILVFLIPILTMRVIAEEKRSGTFELLITSPVSVSDIVWGKFLGIGSVVVIMLILSLVFPLVLVLFANPEGAPIIVGLIGLILFALSLCAIGVALSAFTRSQTIAGITTLVACLLLYLSDTPSEQAGTRVGQILRYLAPTTHSLPMLQGVFSSDHLVYFLSLIAFGLFVAHRALDTERWR